MKKQRIKNKILVDTQENIRSKNTTPEIESESNYRKKNKRNSIKWNYYYKFI